MRLVLKLRKKFIFCLAAMLIVNQSLFFFTVPPVAAQTVASQPGKYRATVEMLDALIRREMADKDLPGISIALVDDQKIVWQQGYGFSDPKAKTPINAGQINRNIR